MRQGRGLAVGLVALSLLGCDHLKRLDFTRREVDDDPAQAKRERETRQQVVAELAVAPLPTGIPLVERDGEDAWGYPKSYVDGPALRSLLHHGRFTELTQYFEHFQREFENDPLKEFWPTRAAESFGSAEPELQAKLDNWVAAMSFSFAPYLARGAHRLAVAWAQRGLSFASKTPTADFDEMRKTLPLVRKDLERALELAPKSMAADRLLIKTALLLSDRELSNAAFAHGKQICPGCLMLRTQYMVSLQPRWGGSYEALEHFARTQADPVNPRLKVLLGFADAERARDAREADRLDEALRFANTACEAGDHWDLFRERALIYAKMEDFDKALADIERAVEMRPDLPQLLMERAKNRARKKDWLNAANDLIAAIRVEATDSEARTWRTYIATGLSDAAWQSHQAGRRDEAVHQIELAELLDPFNPKIRKRKTPIVRGLDASPSAASPQAADTEPADPIANLEAATRERPDDFRAHQQLDYAWAKKRQYGKIIAMWTTYLNRHPDDGMAYFERSGAYHNSGHDPEAFADVAKACTLGVGTACAYAKRLRK